jgi:hypothetical protein
LLAVTARTRSRRAVRLWANDAVVDDDVFVIILFLGVGNRIVIKPKERK